MDLGPAFSHSVDPLVVVDPDRHVVAHNPAAELLFGSCPPRATCDRWLTCQGADGVPLCDPGRCHGLWVLAHRRSLPGVHMRVGTPSGRLLPVHASYSWLGAKRRGQVLISLRPSTPDPGLLQDLHDHLGPTLTALRLLADRVQRRLQEGDASGATEAARATEHAAREAEMQLRRLLTRGAQEAAVSTEDLRHALEDALADLLATERVRVEMNLPSLPLPPEQVAPLLLGVREAARNALQHGGGSCLVRAWQEEGYVVVAVEDRGPGGAGARGGHLGFSSLRRRAHEAGAVLHVQTARGQGTSIRFALPHRSDTRSGSSAP